MIETGDAGLGASLVRIGRIMGRKELAKWRPVMAMALLLTLASKFFSVYAPVYFGDAINKMYGPGATFHGSWSSYYIEPITIVIEKL